MALVALRDTSEIGGGGEKKGRRREREKGRRREREKGRRREREEGERGERGKRGE